MTGLTLSNLTVGYRSGRHVTRVLSGVTGSVVAGQMIGLVGPNGAGTVSYTHLTLPTILLV